MIGVMDLRERLDDATAGFRAMGRGGMEIMSRYALPVFGSPVQQSSKAGYSWWHVPVGFEVRAPWHKVRMLNCTVHLITVGIGGPPIDLCWMPDAGGVPRGAMTLHHGDPVLVPVVARRETADGMSLITNETYFREKKAVWNLNPRSYSWKLELRCGKKRWESPHYYVVRVPPPGVSNGHFTLEVRHQEPQ